MLLQNDDETTWRLVVSGVGEEGKQEGEQHSGLNDFLAVQRDVKDRPMRDGVASKLMSYILDGVKGKNGDVGGGCGLSGRDAVIAEMER